MASIARHPRILGRFSHVSRVTGYNWDPGKHWYVVSKLAYDLRLKMNLLGAKFSPTFLTKYAVASIHRKPAKRSCYFNRQPSHSFVVSPFELYARLPRQRECAKDGLARSSKFGPVVEGVKGIALDCDSPCSVGGKNFELSHSALLGSIYRIEVILPSH